MDIMSIGLTEGKSFTINVNDVLRVEVKYLGGANYLLTNYLYGVEIVKARFDKSDLMRVLDKAFQDYLKH